MAIWQFEFRLVDLDDTTMVHGWHRRHISATRRPALERDLRDYLGQSASWSPDAIIFGNVDRTDVTLFVDDDGSAEVSVRVSLQHSGIDELRRIYDIAERHDLSIVIDDTTVLTTISQLIEAAMTSDAASFCRNPQGFIDLVGHPRPRYVIISERPSGRLNLMGLVPDCSFYGVYSSSSGDHTNPATNQESRFIQGSISQEDYNRVVSLIDAAQSLAAPIPRFGQDGVIGEGFPSDANIIFRYNAQTTAPEARAAFNEIIDILMAYVQPLFNEAVRKE